MYSMNYIVWHKHDLAIQEECFKRGQNMWKTHYLSQSKLTVSVSVFSQDRHLDLISKESRHVILQKKLT